MVNFQLTDEQKDMQELFRKFAQEQIAPIAEEIDDGAWLLRRSFQ